MSAENADYISEDIKASYSPSEGKYIARNSSGRIIKWNKPEFDQLVINEITAVKNGSKTYQQVVGEILRREFNKTK